MDFGNQITAGGFVPAAGEGQALWFPGSLAGPKADGDLYATPFAAGQAPAVPRQQPTAGRDSYGVQPLAYPGRVRRPFVMSRVRQVIGRRWS